MSTEDPFAPDSGPPTLPAPRPTGALPDCGAPELSEVLQDGDTIWFRLSEHATAGCYHLQTSLFGEPQALFRDGVRLALGGDDEGDVLRALLAWLEGNVDAGPAEYRVRAVIRCLLERQPGV